jgi:hypothetical protein
MTPSETIRLQALKLKATIDGSHSSLIDSILENPSNAEGLKKDFRNVCALIPSPLFVDLEGLCTMLELSKREVITMAINSFLIEAAAIVSEVNPFANESAVRSLTEA